MILAVRHRGETRYLRNLTEIAQSIDDVLDFRVRGEGDVRATWLYLEKEGDRAFVSCLEVSLNLRSGYGGAVWFAGGREAARIEGETGSDIGYYFWVSDNEMPPLDDPKVVSDPHNPSYFDYRGVLPVREIRLLVEEYCVSVGDRPAGFRWVVGNQNGTRLT
ncbi:hypothetical protein AB4039_35800 [Streptomyces sp. M-16]|uniref:hypothetical protein n=1 Tax=Streptomyces sp. M-16 TaxID=3233040 RepID=UPI003F957A00